MADKTEAQDNTALLIDQAVVDRVLRGGSVSVEDRRLVKMEFERLVRVAERYQQQSRMLKEFRELLLLSD